MKYFRSLFGLSLSTVIAIQTAGAAVTIFTDRSAFLDAVNNLNGPITIFEEDFNNVASDLDFHTSPLTVNGFSVVGTGSFDTGTVSLVDVASFIASGKQAVDGTAYARLQHQATPTSQARGYEISFSDPTVAFGADVSDVEQANTNLLLSTGETIDLTTTGARGLQFIGVTADTAFTSIQSLSSGSGDTVGMDNVISAQVPEPSFSGVCLGFFALIAAAKRRRKLAKHS